MQRLTIEGITCYLEENKTDDAPFMLYHCGGAEHEREAETLCALLKRQIGTYSWTLIGIAAQDWNRDYSPWPADAVFGEENFSGGGEKTLERILKKRIPRFEEIPAKHRLIGGYSLAGLFSLWAFYESGMFDGVASCSGSLWYPRWDAYADQKKAAKASYLYLSLGRKEPNTRHPVLTKVGEETQRQFLRAKSDANIDDCAFIWNDGGHFGHAAQRTADGFSWLVRAMQK